METGSKPWTKRELTVYKDGTVELAKAVVRQWQLDGCPKQDLEAIEYWKGVIETYENQTERTGR